MGMDSAYERLHHQAEDLEHRMRDSTDHHDDPSAERLRREIEALQDHLETGRKPRDLENQVKQIQALLEKARRTPDSFMSIPDADRYYRIFEDMRMGLRKFPNYS